MVLTNITSIQFQDKYSARVDAELGEREEVGRRMGQALAAKRLKTTLYNEQNMCRLFPYGYPYFDVLFDVPQRL